FRQQIQQRRECSHGNLRSRLPPQESDVRRFANPRSYPTRHFAEPVLHPRLSSACPVALNSLEVGSSLQVCMLRSNWQSQSSVRKLKGWIQGEAEWARTLLTLATTNGYLLINWIRPTVSRLES